MTARYRLVMRAYPAAYRAAHGGELAATADELAKGRWSARQAAALVIEGLRTRARLTSGGSARPLWVGGIGLALALWYLPQIAGPIAYSLGATSDIVSFSRPYWTAAVLPLVALVGLTATTRWPAALLITTAAAAVAALSISEPTSGGGQLHWVPLLVPTAAPVPLAWWLALAGDGRRALSPAAALVAVSFAVGLSWVTDSPGAASVVLCIHLILSLTGMALVMVDPRTIIAATATWLLSALGLVRVVALGGIDRASVAVVGVPAMLAGLFLVLAGLGTRRAREPGLRLYDERLS